MTVQELIDELNKIEDKSLEVCREDCQYCDDFPIECVWFAPHDSYKDKQVVVLGGKT